jgi:hypothetical protein
LNRKLLSVVASIAVVTAIASPGFATDRTPQRIERVDVTNLADGFRTSKMVGAPGVNDGNQTIGKIADLRVGRSDRVLYAILSVGGFLRVGGKLIAVPHQSLQIANNNLVLPGANKEELKALPEFKYSTR